MRTNVIRQKLAAGLPTICTRTRSVWPDVVEIIGNLGVYDYVEYTAEYTPYTLADLDNYCRAAEIYNLGTMIKVDLDGNWFMAQRAIGSGFQSVLFVDCRNVEDVKRCVQIARPDTPDHGGFYGAAPRRFAYTGGDRSQYVQALNDIVVAIMIEKHSAVEQLDEILSVPGVDMIQWGPADFAMSSNAYKPGSTLDIKAVERRVIESALKKGIAPRVELKDLTGIEPYLEMGVKHFRIGDDLSVLQDFWKQMGTNLQKMLTAVPVHA